MKEATITEFGPQKLNKKNGCTSVDLNKKILYYSLLYCILCGMKLKWFKGKLAAMLGLKACCYGIFKTLLVRYTAAVSNDTDARESLSEAFLKYIHTKNITSEPKCHI